MLGPRLSEDVIAMKKKRPKFAPPTGAQPVVGSWGVWVSPGLYVQSTNHTFGPPTRFHRLMQRWLLGWVWEQGKR